MPGVQCVVSLSADSNEGANDKSCWSTNVMLGCAKWHGLTRCQLWWPAPIRMSCHLGAWVGFQWHDTAARKHRLADFERIASRSISRGGSYPLRVIPGQLRGSQTLWSEATANLIHGRDVREHAPTTNSEHEGSRAMRPCNRTHRVPHPRTLPHPSSPTRRRTPRVFSYSFQVYERTRSFLTWTVQCTARVTVGTSTCYALRFFRVCFSFLCVSDIWDYDQLPVLMCFTFLKYRALPTERVLNDSHFPCSSRACLGICNRLSSACPGVTVISCLVSCYLSSWWWLGGPASWPSYHARTSFQKPGRIPVQSLLIVTCTEWLTIGCRWPPRCASDVDSRSLDKSRAREKILRRTIIRFVRRIKSFRAHPF